MRGFALLLTVSLATTAVADEIHIVERGETLGGISRQYYGNPSMYRRIAAANRIANPNLIRVGQELTIPGIVSDRPPAAATTTVRSSPPDLRAASTSLRIESGHEHDRNDVLRDFLRRLDARYDEALSASPALGRAWKELSALMGKRVTVVESGREHSGEVVDLDVLEGISLRLTHAVRRFRLEHVERLRES